MTERSVEVRGLDLELIDRVRARHDRDAPVSPVGGRAVNRPFVAAAAVLGLSKSHFMRLFKQVTGQPFVVYLNHFRIAKAQALLVATDFSISEVSLEVGFCDQSYFGFMFRNLLNMTPLQYRRQCGCPTRRLQ